MKDHKELEAWKLSVELVTHIYRLTSFFPSGEKVGLIGQMRRAAVSIPSNTSEGAGRQSEREFLQFLYVALGSASELETQVIIAHRLDYLKVAEESLGRIDSLKRLINGLIRYYKRKGTGK